MTKPREPTTPNPPLEHLLLMAERARRASEQLAAHADALDAAAFSAASSGKLPRPARLVRPELLAWLDADDGWMPKAERKVHVAAFLDAVRGQPTKTPVSTGVRVFGGDTAVIRRVLDAIDGTATEQVTRARMQLVEVLVSPSGELGSAILRFRGAYPEYGVRVTDDDWPIAVRTMARRGGAAKNEAEPWPDYARTDADGPDDPRYKWDLVARFVRKAGLGPVAGRTLENAWAAHRRTPPR